MKAVVIRELGHDPVYGEFEEPVPGEGEVRVALTASALTNFTKVRAAGRHVSAATRPPFVAGIDGVGRRDDGRRVYFLFPRAPFGGMAERTVVASERCILVPDTVDDVMLAALADPGMSSWVALEARAELAPGETVLVNGATGSAGRVAGQVARHLGAGRVIATGRDRAVLESLLARGADAIVPLTDDPARLTAALREEFERGVDVVLDYLWGPPAQSVLTATNARTSRSPLRYVQIGTTAGAELELPGQVLRATDLRIMGSGIGSVAVGHIMQIIDKLMQAAATVEFVLDTRAYPLSRIGELWSATSVTPRTVVTVDTPA
jgi:NADPH:quinone reductase-like Zn-dependent oxidoreductase